MLNRHEKKMLGRQSNWTYPVNDTGIKIIALSAETLRVLGSQSDKRDRLVNLIAFDAHLPVFIEIDQPPSDAGVQQGLAQLYQDLHRVMADRLNGSRVVYHVQAADLGWGSYYTPEDIRIRFRIFANLDHPAPWADRPDGLSNWLQSHREDTLALVRAAPSGTGLLADAVDALIDRRMVHLSITIDHHQDWDTADFPVIQAQWERILAVARPELDAGRLCIAQVRRIVVDGQDYCRPGTERIFVAPDGTLWPCRQFYSTRDSKAFAIGNLDQGLNEYDNAPFTLFEPDDMPDCRECDWRGSCDNRCLWSNHQQHNTLYRTSGSVCAYEKAVRKAVENTWGAGSAPIMPRSRLDDYWPLMCPL
jgi:radical SAM protein with 4Fe4S-binding SPASM domain